MENNLNENSQDNKKFLKNIGNKLADEENDSVKVGQISKELEGLSKNENLTQEKILIKEKDIELLKSDLEITYDEAKALLIKNKGDVSKVIDSFLNDFKFRV